MGETTKISWCDHTANFWMGCVRVSPGCEHCYAESLVTGRMGLPVWGPPSTTERHRAKGVWKDVPKWNRDALAAGVRRRMFVSSLSDIFEDHPMVAPWRAEALALLETCTGLDVQLLTKRPENIRRMVPAHWLERWPWHVQVGTTAENCAMMERRSAHLRTVPALVRFLSCEPLLEDLGTMDLGGISWLIVGGESGPSARPFDLAWARSIVEQCADSDVQCFVKQMGDNPFDDGARVKFRAHHGADPSEWPEDLRVQEFPAIVETYATRDLFDATETP